MTHRVRFVLGIVAIVAVIAPALTVAQAPAVPAAPAAGPAEATAQKTFASAAEIAAKIKAEAARPPGSPPTGGPLLHLAPYNANLEYRAAPGMPAIHEKDAEVFVVLDGAGTVVLGGKLIGESRRGDNLSGTGVEGGTAQKLAKGDVFVVPENTVHWFKTIDAPALVMISLHVPRPAP